MITIDENQFDDYVAMDVITRFGRVYRVVVDIEEDAGAGEVRVYDVEESPDEPSDYVKFSRKPPRNISASASDESDVT